MPGRRELPESFTTNPGVVAPGTTSIIRRCSTAQTLPDAESWHAVIFFATMMYARSFIREHTSQNSRSRSSSSALLPESLAQDFRFFGGRSWLSMARLMDLVLMPSRPAISRCVPQVRLAVNPGTADTTCFEKNHRNIETQNGYAQSNSTAGVRPGTRRL